MSIAKRNASRRRISVGLLTLFLTAALLTVLPPSAKAESSRINSMDITCQIDANGDAVITEVIDIDAYQGTEYYQVVNVRGNQQVRDLVVSENGITFENVGEWDVNAAEKRGRSGIVTTASGYELCFGIGEYGNHVFEMRYTVENFVSRWSDSYGVNYMFFSDIPLMIESAAVTLEGPDVYSDENASIWAFGYDGAVVFEDGRVVMETDNSHLRGMQLLMVFENGREFAHTNDYDADRTFMDVYEEAEEDSSYEQEEHSGGGSGSGSRSSKFIWLLPALFVGCFAAIIAMFATLGTKKVYEDPEGYKQAKSRSVTPYRDIPCGKDLVMFSRVLTDLRGSSEFLKSTLISAYILKWLQKDVISVVEGPEKGILKKTQTYKIVLTESPAILDLNEQHLYNMLWKAAREDHILEKNEFQRYCKRNYSDVERWFDNVREAGTQRLREKGLIRSERVAQKGLIPRKRNIETYTAAYNEELARVNGFEKFLEDEDNMAEKSLIEVKLWDEYLVFAAVMGIADQVYRQAKLAVPQFDERYYGYDPYMTYLVASSFGEAGARGAAAGASSSDGSSSFGGGGGSFSGGGGGGLR